MRRSDCKGNSLAGKRQTIIDVVRSPKNSQDFPGLFAVPFKCLTYAFASSDRILLTSQWRSTIQVNILRPERKDTGTPLHMPKFVLKSSAHVP